MPDLVGPQRSVEESRQERNQIPAPTSSRIGLTIKGYLKQEKNPSKALSGDFHAHNEPQDVDVADDSCRSLNDEQIVKEGRPGKGERVRHEHCTSVPVKKGYHVAFSPSTTVH